MPTQTATFAAGCFWGVEAGFRELPGVVATSVGYTGGSVPDPSYKRVCRGRTGHAEAVQVEFDPEVITYEELLERFWTSHNPTTRNRQGWDIGSQYRSAIFYHTPEQEAAAQESKATLDASDTWKKPIVTEITPTSEFYRAEEYHQQYLAKRGMSSCRT